jgi:hypothetical protein
MRRKGSEEGQCKEERIFVGGYRDGSGLLGEPGETETLSQRLGRRLREQDSTLKYLSEEWRKGDVSYTEFAALVKSKLNVIPKKEISVLARNDITTCIESVRSLLRSKEFPASVLDWLLALIEDAAKTRSSELYCTQSSRTVKDRKCKHMYLARVVYGRIPKKMHDVIFGSDSTSVSSLLLGWLGFGTEPVFSLSCFHIEVN